MNNKFYEAKSKSICQSCGTDKCICSDECKCEGVCGCTDTCKCECTECVN